MTVNFAARQLSVLIGGQDWSDWVVSLVTGYSELSDNAPVYIEATLTLAMPNTFSLLPSDPRIDLNPTQWQRGVGVRVQVSNAAGTLVPHPCGYLYLVETPPYPQINSDWVLKLGCGLKLNNFRQADGSYSSATNRGDIIADLLDSVNLRSSLDDLPYPLLPKSQKTGSSVVEQAGQIARAANAFLYSNNAGAVRSASIDLTANRQYDSFVIGTDEGIWEPSTTGELPINQLTVTATIAGSASSNETITTREETLGRAKDVDKALTRPDSERIVTIRMTTIKQYPYNAAGRFQRKVTKIEEPAEIAVPGFNTDKFQMVVSSYLLETDYYDLEGKLLKHVVETEETQGAIFSVVVDSVRVTQCTAGAFDLRLGTRVTTEYVYAANKTVAAIETLTEDCMFRLDATLTDFPFELRRKAKIVEVWQELRPDFWKYGITNYKARLLIDGTSEREAGFDSYDLVLDSSAKNTVTTGSDRTLEPAATIYYKAATGTNADKILSVDINSSLQQASQYLPRTRTIDLQYATDIEQLQAYGELFDRLLYGRRLGWRIGFALKDEWLSASVRPLLPVQITYDGRQMQLVLDGLTYTHSQTEAFVIASGIRVVEL